jgi:hypothetical protein
MKKIIKYSFFTIVLSFVIGNLTFVHAEYVLPYPSFMPGNKLYRISRLIDVMKKYWYFGDIAQFKYRLTLSDKYLVEAKTLFEYKQYLLGFDALKRSSTEWQKAVPTTPSMLLSYQEAAKKHIEVLERMDVPDNFLWSPEKSASSKLPLRGEIENAIQLRKKTL